MPVYCDGRPCDGGSSSNGITSEGGFVISLINKTGANSIKGTIIEASHTDENAFGVADANSDHPIGVVLDNGVADGEYCRVVVGGKAQVLMKDTEAATVGYWVRTSDVAGRAIMEISPNPSFHWQEIGHSLENQLAGTNVLVWIDLHFN